MKTLLSLFVLNITSTLVPAFSFQHGKITSGAAVSPLTRLHEKKVADSMSVDEYRNGITQLLSNFMQKEKVEMDPLADIDFAAPKVAKMKLEELASELDRELYEKEWFVTGRVNPAYFDDGFQFQDPDVKLTGIEGMPLGVILQCFFFHYVLTRCMIYFAWLRRVCKRGNQNLRSSHFTCSNHIFCSQQYYSKYNHSYLEAQWTCKHWTKWPAYQTVHLLHRLYNQ
jgi:hypothetical protein